MAGLAEVVVPGLPHHVTQRGNRRMEAFFGEGDYRAYLSLMGQWLADRRAGWVCTWREYLAGVQDDGLAARMRRCERMGRPLGNDGFLTRLGVMIGRSLLPGRPGRPRKRLKTG